MQTQTINIEKAFGVAGLPDVEAPKVAAKHKAMIWGQLPITSSRRSGSARHSPGSRPMPARHCICTARREAENRASCANSPPG